MGFGKIRGRGLEAPILWIVAYWGLLLAQKFNSKQRHEMQSILWALLESRYRIHVLLALPETLNVAHCCFC